MLKQISSTSFIETTLLVTAAYYLAVALVFYRSDIRLLITKKMSKKLQRPPSS
ncbi:MAG: hypothetical protein J0H07_32930 [Sphingobacteriales bacterium]|nr:hypothetical protein [Sphingobacteriales bacterium]